MLDNGTVTATSNAGRNEDAPLSKGFDLDIQLIIEGLSDRIRVHSIPRQVNIVKGILAQPRGFCALREQDPRPSDAAPPRQESYTPS